MLNVTHAKIVWNGKYFLMDNGYSLIEYDGRKFEVYRYVEGYYSPLSILGRYYFKNRWILVYLDEGTRFFICVKTWGNTMRNTCVLHMVIWTGLAAPGDSIIYLLS